MFIFILLNHKNVTYPTSNHVLLFNAILHCRLVGSRKNVAGLNSQKFWHKRFESYNHSLRGSISGVPRKFSGGGDARKLFFPGGSTNSVEDREQGERVSGGGSPLVRGSTQFANE
jgi:hypothetical protein